MLLGLAAAAPAPPGPWFGPIHGKTPTSLDGGQVLHTLALRALLRTDKPILLDVSEAPRRPKTATTALWMPLPHQDIPGSIWIPGAGLGAIPPTLALFLAQRLATLTHGHANAPIVVYCHPHCWMSWNAARRLVWLGYQRVYWDPDGIEGWEKAGLTLATVSPSEPSTK